MIDSQEVSKSKQTTVNELKILELIAVEIVESVQDLEESDVYSNGCYEDDDALKAQFHHVFDAAVARLTRIRDAHYDAERAKHLASPDGIPNIVKETIKALGTVQTGRNSLRQKIRKRQYGKHMELLVRADRVLMEAERTDRELKELRGEKAAMKGELQRLSEKNEQLLARLDEHAKKTVRVDELLKGVELLCKQPPIKHNRRVTQSAEYSKVSDWVVVSPIPERAAKESRLNSDTCCDRKIC